MSKIDDIREKNEVYAMIYETVPPPLCVSETAVSQLWPRLVELIRLRELLHPAEPQGCAPELPARPFLQTVSGETYDTKRTYQYDAVIADDFKVYADAIEAQLQAANEKLELAEFDVTRLKHALIGIRDALGLSPFSKNTVSILMAVPAEVGYVVSQLGEKLAEAEKTAAQWERNSSAENKRAGDALVESSNLKGKLAEAEKERDELDEALEKITEPGIEFMTNALANAAEARLAEVEKERDELASQIQGYKILVTCGNQTQAQEERIVEVLRSSLERIASEAKDTLDLYPRVTRATPEQQAAIDRAVETYRVSHSRKQEGRSEPISVR